MSSRFTGLDHKQNNTFLTYSSHIWDHIETETALQFHKKFDGLPNILSFVFVLVKDQIQRQFECLNFLQIR
jgi:hypothetical protein